MQRFYFSLDISASEYLRYYQGSARRVLVRAHDARSLSIPAANLRPFVTSAGVKGRFCLTVDQDHRLISLERQTP
ncbi:DUF2835 domain-containing protein [Thiocystis violacea]|uniref:DUF2835 domain-containing protein n=1 Tax=Thiocystis violacea TaxID=13725 RepID=UPI001907A1A6|nr:DUF2835 domain-containing protein [Thiocystis violacea]MBK1718486.1 hypothetical protein [Thiocystis violacea]